MVRIWRLRPHGEFERVRQQGRSWSQRWLVVVAAPRRTAPADPARVAVVAGKRLGSAVLRNKIRRRLRAALQPIAPQLPTGIDLIIIARAPIVNASVAELTQALTEVLKRAQLWQVSDLPKAR
jgi:ribonuclease P protein component